MNRWKSHFLFDPVAPLVGHADEAIAKTARRDLLQEHVDIKELWSLKEPAAILRRQLTGGAWYYPGAKEHVRSQTNYNQVETYRQLGFLIEKYGFNKSHPSVRRAAEFFFQFQGDEGDIRGIYGNQYTPNYSAGIGELLIKAGYGSDARIGRLHEWLLGIRQSDGGWTIPFRTQNSKLGVVSDGSPALLPDKSKPFSHLVTGVVLRMFAAHPVYAKSAEAKQAGRLLVSNLFEKDNYSDRGTPDFWTKFTYPFWFTDLLSALDSLSLLGFTGKEPKIKQALEWFVEHQSEDGLWKLKVLKNRNRQLTDAWLSLAICRVFKRIYGM